MILGHLRYDVNWGLLLRRYVSFVLVLRFSNKTWWTLAVKSKNWKKLELNLGKSVERWICTVNNAYCTNWLRESTSQFLSNENWRLGLYTKVGYPCCLFSFISWSDENQLMYFFFFSDTPFLNSWPIGEKIRYHFSINKGNDGINAMSMFRCLCFMNVWHCLCMGSICSHGTHSLHETFIDW